MDEFRSFSVDPVIFTRGEDTADYPDPVVEDDPLAETISAGLAIQIDEVSDTVSYVGRAEPGTLTSGFVWQISRLTETGPDLVVEWAEGTSEFDKVWDNRLLYNYS